MDGLKGEASFLTEPPPGEVRLFSFSLPGKAKLHTLSELPAQGATVTCLPASSQSPFFSRANVMRRFLPALPLSKVLNSQNKAKRQPSEVCSDELFISYHIPLPFTPIGALCSRPFSCSAF